MSAVIKTNPRTYFSYAHQTGAAILEFTAMAVPLVLISLGTIELSSWFYTRQALHTVLLDAAREATTKHIHPEAIINTLENGLTPLFAKGPRAQNLEAINSGLELRRQQIKGAPWQITVLSPSYSAFKDFQDSSLYLPKASGLAIVNNYFLAEQDLNNKKRGSGWVNGSGPISGQNIYQANTLTLEFYWPHRPAFTPFAYILKLLSNSSDSYAKKVLKAGYLPIKRSISLMMHSHPVLWPNHSSGKVLFEQGYTTNPCKGWLCSQTTRNQQTHTDNTTDNNDYSYTNEGEWPANNAEDFIDPSNPINSGSLPDVGNHIFPNPECGITMCCVF